ncbi:MAG: hybrid sensor histidine kinase/response regulator [Magnetococcales bacterium]|nr:hybrid sensor histidine kinase/response regulator [Magnetococcales bacterium]
MLTAENNRRPIILVVDDTPENIDVLRSALQADYAVRVAPSGRVALKAVKILPLPDLVLLDIMMQDMDGYEVCRQLKADPVTASIPIIFVTAKTGEADQLAGLNLGAVDYITKPFSIPIVQTRVKTHLTVFLQRQLLEKQNLQLLEAARLRDNVAQITRHDLKSPLASIIGFTQLLAKTPALGDKSQGYIKLIETASYRLLNMINHSLDLFQMEEGRYHLQPKEMDLLTILNQVKEEMFTLSRSKNCPITLISQQEESVMIQGERLLCHSLFANLIKNSLEASPVGQAIVITLRREEGWLKVEVQNGGEVPEEIKDRFFDKFITSGKRSGTGLGTYSAQLITHLHQGEIRMKSSAVSGTTVTVRFRLNSQELVGS